MLGNIAESNNSLEEAIKFWANIKNKHNPEIYILAQYSMGMIFEKKNNNKKALECWVNVEKSEDQILREVAKKSIGNILMNNNDTKGALAKWEEIENLVGSYSYASAQYSIGRLLKDKLDDIESAIKFWDKIERKHDPEFYAIAQYSIGLVLKDRGEIEKALKVWRNVRKLDYPEVYTDVQFNVGLLLKENKGDIEGALIVWNEALSSWYEANYTKDIELYEAIQFKIGKTYLEKYKYQDLVNNIKPINKSFEFILKEFKYIGFYRYSLCNKAFKSLKLAAEAFNSFEANYSYEVSCYKRICELLSYSNQKIIGKKYLNIFEVILNMVNILKIKFAKENTENYERKLAHYTSVDVANILLSENNKQEGFLRLNTISNMNDPSEGQLLEAFLSNEEDVIYSSPEFDERFHAFFSCFTFNHDSLNQFRLYGKKDFREASGVSLVFDRDFFQNEDFGSLSFVANTAKSEKGLIKDNVQFSNLKYEKAKSHNRQYIDKQPVMRCVYIDPKSGYIQLAQRSRLTFYREFNKIDEINNNWDLYQNYINKKTEDFNASFVKLKSLYEDLIVEKEVLKERGIEYSQKYNMLLDEIILPLKYLIKHSAFQEEQECRIIYITSLKDSEVQMDFGKFLYVEYEANIKAHLDKIYIAPAATKYQPYLAKLLCDTNAKIELSNNPYRQT